MSRGRFELAWRDAKVTPSEERGLKTNELAAARVTADVTSMVSHPELARVADATIEPLGAGRLFHTSVDSFHAVVARDTSTALSDVLVTYTLS